MHVNRSKRVGIAFGACIFGILVGLHWQREPKYEGQPLSYWLDRLEPTVITAGHSVRHWPTLGFRSQAAVTDWIAQTKEMHERSCRVLRAAGRECLPMLLARLTTQGKSIRSGSLRRWAYTLRLSDSALLLGEDYTEVRRGQALTAIILLQDRAASLVPQLSALAAEDKDDSIHRAASHALYILAPDEFRRIRAPAKALSLSSSREAVETEPVEGRLEEVLKKPVD